ncbi:MAG: radical SAM protein, partial [Clostridia bacterium]|nr:radical SAM protein [Clostridia bacterium]
FGMGVTLREGSREYFYAQLDRHFPGLRRRYERSFGNAYICNSPNNHALMRFCEDFAAAHGMLFGVEQPFAFLRRPPENALRLF